jgi:integrase
MANLAKVPGHTYTRPSDGLQYHLFISEHGVYHAQHQKRGKKIKKSFETKTLAEALPQLHEYWTLTESERVRGGKVKCKLAFEEFLAKGQGPRKALAPATIKLYRELWTLYALEFIGDIHVIDVTHEDIIDILDAAKATGIGKSRRRNVYVMLSSFFNKMRMAPYRYRTDNPVNAIGQENVPPMPKRRKIAKDVLLSQEDIDQIAAAFAIEPKPHTGRGGSGVFTYSRWIASVMRVLFLLLCDSGMRVSEIVALKISDLEYTTGKLHAVDALPDFVMVHRQRSSEYRARDASSPLFGPLKGDYGKDDEAEEIEPREIPLTTYMGEVLVEYLALGFSLGRLNPNGLLFPNTRGKMMFPAHVNNRIKAAAKSVGITKKITTHATRHTFLSHLVEEGCDEQTAATVAGHSLEVMRDVYLHRDRNSKAHDRLRAAVDSRRARAV